MDEYAKEYESQLSEGIQEALRENDAIYQSRIDSLREELATLRLERLSSRKEFRSAWVQTEPLIHPDSLVPEVLSIQLESADHDDDDEIRAMFEGDPSDDELEEHLVEESEVLHESRGHFSSRSCVASPSKNLSSASLCIPSSLSVDRILETSSPLSSPFIGSDKARESSLRESRRISSPLVSASVQILGAELSRTQRELREFQDQLSASSDRGLSSTTSADENLFQSCENSGSVSLSSLVVAVNREIADAENRHSNMLHRLQNLEQRMDSCIRLMDRLCLSVSYFCCDFSFK